MTRRKFIKAGALFVPATFGILIAGGASYLPNRRQAFRRPAAGGGGPDTYYYGVGSDDYTNVATFDWDDEIHGDTITIGASGTLTKIRVKVQNTHATGHNVKIILWKSPGPTTFHECVTVAIPASHDGWVEGTLSTSLSVSASDVVRVTGICDDAGFFVGLYNNVVGAGDRGTDTRGYANGCNTTSPAYDSVGSRAVSVYVD